MAQLVDDRKSATIERRAKLFRGFADPSRLAILGALCNELGPETSSSWDFFGRAHR